MKNIIFLSFLMIIMSCGSTSSIEKYLTEEEGAIPPEFGQKGTVFLLNEESDNNIWYKKLLRNRAEDEYEGPYKIIGREDLKSDAYADKDIYRYVFLSRNNNDIFFSGNSNTNPNGFSTSEYKFFLVLDRKTGKEYKSKIAPAKWGKHMRAYIKKLNEKRVSNGG